MGQSICEKCNKPSMSLFLEDSVWICKYCRSMTQGDGIYFKEVGIENPYDPKGSTAHVRDIKNRRLDTKTGKMFYHQPPKRYFY